VLETTANGVNLGLQLADGRQIQFASTARLADFLYATAVQQMQATSFVTDNFNLDVQWLNTVDQPLLNEAVGWNEHAAAVRALGGANYDQQAVEANTMASLALQIAAQPPSSRHDITVTIANPVAGNPTEVTAYAGGGGSIHDTTPGLLSYIEPVISLALNITAAVTGQAYLYFAAAALDAVQSGQAFSNGQDLQGLLDLAQAVSAGITGGAGGTLPGTPPPVPAQIINAAAQGVGGVYGAVQSAQSGNAAGILAGALEAAAAGAAGIGMLPGTQAQTLNLISAALGSAGIATNMASDFASGNLGQGLLDSLNLYLPAVAQAFANASTDSNITSGNDVTSDQFILVSSSQPTNQGINFQIITQNEGGILATGNIPNDNGAVLGHSGMTIGAGIDIGNQSVSGIQNLVQNFGLSADLAQTLEPYVGITGQPALAFLQANPITLSSYEVTNLDESFWSYAGASLAAKFDSTQTFAAGFTFTMLPSDTQTAIADMYWHYANASNGFLTTTQLWTQIITGNWSEAASNIETWSSSSVARNQAMGNLIMHDLNAGLLPTPGH